MSNKDQPKRLGRGLAALLGEAAVPAGVEAPGVRGLAVALLEPSPFQPRREMDGTALEELAASIRQRGILQPLLVRPHPGKAEHFQIIAGERRWRAAQKVPLHEVPVLVRTLSDADAMAAGLVENLQREDLNPVEEAEGYQRLIVEFKLTQDAMADAIGKSRAHITNLLRVLKLPEKVLVMLREGDLSIGQAKAVLGHADPLKAARIVVNKQMTVRQAEEFVEHAGRSIKPDAISQPPRPTKRNDADSQALQMQLSERLGLRVKVVFDGKGGSVTMHYKNLDQLDSIVTLLNG